MRGQLEDDYQWIYELRKQAHRRATIRRFFTEALAVIGFTVICLCLLYWEV